MVNIGDRLKEERERLRMTQESFSVAGGAGKRAYIRYEQGERLPDAGFLAAISASGADVLYIVTGQRNERALSSDEQTLIGYYREAPPAVRRAAMGALLGAASSSSMTMHMGDVSQVSNHPGSVQVGYAGGGVSVSTSSVKKSQKKAR